MDDSYFHARRVDGRIVATGGQAQCALGHRIERADGKADGIFAQWSWDGARLTAGNDRYGFYPLYYYCRDGEIAISPSIARLIEAGAGTGFDAAALAVYLRLGFFIGEDTPYAQIRALPPDATLSWDGTLRLASGGRAPGRPQGALSRPAAIGRYAELFRLAIERRPPRDPHFIVPLSGGRDSRHILFELLRQGHRPQACVTTAHFPPRSNEDARTAAALTRELGLPHVLLQQAHSFFSAERRKNPLTNFCSDEHAWFMVALDHLAGRTPVIYDGIGGDVLSAGLFLTERRLGLFEAGATRPIAEHLLAADESAFARLLQPALYAAVGRELAISRLESELRAHLGRPNPVGSFYFWNRTRREIALIPYGLLGAVPTVYAPYLDHELYDFLAGLPARMLLDQQFHTDTILRSYPQYAHIAFENKHAPAADTFDSDVAFGRELARCLLSSKPSRLMRKRFLWPRLLAALCSRKHSAASNWYAPLALYLHQLERLPAGAAALKASAGRRP
ncbi:asparagine synthetase B family protein [Janthinobacterium sp.]|uniref:asparagine synthetase B family protein n=1 Tax=Janthinobacterium sp. TaxID=1871054 RepID=UPI00293D9866|nr:asparagine synthetase B family protein [Janthinobacterium sp.]